MTLQELQKKADDYACSIPTDEGACTIAHNGYLAGYEAANKQRQYSEYVNFGGSMTFEQWDKDGRYDPSYL
jgi:hypothetical protein